MADRCGSSFPAGRFTASWVLFIALPCLGLAPFESALPTFNRSVAVIDLAVVDHSPVPDVARAGASLAASGNTAAAWLASHLASNGYEPVEAARIGRALQTMGTPASGCADAACAAQLGRAIGAELVVFGRVIKVSDLIWLVVALYSIRARTSGSTAAVVSTSTQGNRPSKGETHGHQAG